MERQSTSWGYCSAAAAAAGTTRRDIIEQAKEELQILEAQQPNRFNYLKLELKSFISDWESKSSDVLNTIKNVSCVNSKPVNISSSSVMTQESSAGKKRKKVGSEDGHVVEGKNVEVPKQKLQKISCISSGVGCSKISRERTDVVVERARACLQKIQQLKTSLS